MSSKMVFALAKCEGTLKVHLYVPYIDLDVFMSGTLDIYDIVCEHRIEPISKL